MKRFSKTLLALILCFSMLIGISPINAVTQTEQAQPSQEQEQQVFTLPDIIPTSEAEEKGYVGRDTESETDLNTFVFKNADGTNTLRLFDHPVKYVDENGVTKDISLELKRESNGSFVSTDHEISTTFSKNLSDGIELEYEDISIKLFPQTSTAKSTLSTTTMPIASVSSDNKSVSYPIDTKTSYEYELTYAGFKEDIVVSEYTGVTEYNFILQTNGLTLTKIQESYFLTDEKGEIKANIGDIIVFTADERNNTMGSMTYQTVKANEIYAMTIHLDADYLSDPDTKYPIRIDPTIEINYDSNGAGAIQDVTINSLDPDDSSGDSGALYVGLRNTYGISRVLMRFPNLSLSSISSASAITAATVELRDVLCPETATTVTCHPFTGNSWTDSNATWNTVSPNSYGTQMSSNAVSYSNGVNLSTAHRYSFNILAAVKGWKNGTYTQSKGLIFKSNAETTTKNATFASYNRSANKPSLSITYNSTTPGNTFDNAINISSGAIYVVDLDGTSDNRYFKFVPTTTDFYTFKSSMVSNYAPRARLYNSSRSQLSTSNVNGSSSRFSLTYHLNAGSTYYFSAGSNNSACSYTIYLLAADSTSSVTHSNITMGQTSLSINIPYETRCFGFTPSISGRYYFASYYNSNNPKIWIYNASFGQIAYHDDIDSTLNFGVRVSLNANQKYYIVIGENSNSTGDCTLQVCRSLSHVNYYDSTFANDSSLRNKIQSACGFADDVFSFNFNLSIHMDGNATQYATIIDSCNTGTNSPCKTTNCGDCASSHHKNLINISDQIYNDTRENDHIYTLWTNRSYGVYCTGTSIINTHVTVPEGADAVVYANRPVIHVMHISGDDSAKKQAYMSINLAHEIAHTLGMGEVYLNSSHCADGTKCIMSNKYESEIEYNFYTSILTGETAPFCSSCESTLNGLVNNITINGN